jgi:cytochrome c
MKATRTSLLTVTLFTAAIGLAPRPAAAVDENAAKELMKSNQCNKCHSVDKDKTGPSLKKIAAKYKGKAAEGEQAIIKNITTAPKVKLDDGTEEEHKVIKTKDPAELKNLAQWILSQ